MEAPSGFEPEIKVLQTSALPLGYGAIKTTTKLLYALKITLSTKTIKK